MLITRIKNNETGINRAFENSRNLNYKKMENDEIKYIKCYCVSVGKPILNDAILLTGIYKALSYDDIKKAVFWEIQILFSEN